MNKSKINLCLVIPSLQAGGMEKVMWLLAKHFAQKKVVDLHLILFGKNPEIFYNLPKNICIHRAKDNFRKNMRLWYTLNRLLFLRRTIRKIKPDTILSFGEYWNSFVLLSLLGIKYPVYISDRCQPNKDFGRFHNLLRKWLYPKAAGIIAQTSIAREIYLKQKLNNHIKVIGNPIRNIEFKESSVIRENIIISVGRLIKTKHHNELIRIFARINDPNWKLVIVGDDALKQKNRSSLESLVRALNVEKRVIFAGQIKDMDIYYQRSKIFAFPSSSEGFPNVIGEAQAAGLPVVAFDCIAGPADLIEDGENGFLVPLYDYDAFRQRLHQLMKDEFLRKKLGDKAKETIEQFSANKISEDYYQMIIA